MAAKTLTTTEQVKAALKKGSPTHFSMHDYRSETAQRLVGGSMRIIGDIDELKSCYAQMIWRMEACPKPDDWSKRHARDARAVRFAGWLDFVNHPKTPVVTEMFPSKIIFNKPRPQDMSPWFYLGPFEILTDLNPFERGAGERVVSRELRAAIEELEPGMATFIPLALHFSDQIVEGYSWMPEKARFQSGLRPDRTDIEWPPGYSIVYIQGNPLDGVHWGFWHRWQYVVSAEMLARLQPLMPLREFNKLEINPVVHRKL
jgi:hypothetical protein